MRTITTRRRGIALAAASAVAASTLLGLQTGPAAAAVPTPTHGATVDYFDDVYTNLGPNSVFETVTIERFKYILENVSGNVAFFIGDPSQASSQATIGHINAVAKQQGIDHIYNFTPKIDGDTLNVWDLSTSGLRALGRDYYATEGDSLITKFLSKDEDTPFTKDASTDPYLFVYNKDQVDGDDPDRIVSALTGVTTAADLDTAGEVEDYRDDVEDVLGAVEADDYVTTTNFEFQKATNNLRHAAGFPIAETHGGNILEDSDAEAGFRIKTLTYPELEHLLQQPGEFPILFGGTWCHNTRAIIKFVNADAQKYGIKTVYNFDFSLFSRGNGGSNYDHIRANPAEELEDGVLKAARPSHLYGDLVNTYLTNIVAEYKKTGDPGPNAPSPAFYFPGGNTSLPKQEARRIQVGHLLTYNKDHKDALGNDAPVVDQAIRNNDDGSNTEHMTEWWYTSGANLPVVGGNTDVLKGPTNTTSQAGINTLQNQRNFAKEAIDEIDTILGGLADRTFASTTSITGLGAGGDSALGVGAAPIVAVSVNSADYSSFISLNAANVNTAAVTGAGKPRGFVGVFKGDEQVGDAVRLSRTGAASITLPPQTAGAKSYTVRYLGRGDAIAASSTPLQFNVAGDLSTTTLSGPTSVVFGAGGTITATVPAGATGTVTLRGLPGAPIVAPVAEGVATIALPAAVPAGTHALVATYSGDDKYASSTTTTQRVLTVSKAASSVKASATGASYGTPATINITSTGPGTYVPTGNVRVSVAGGTYSATLDAQGRAVVALPRTLLPKIYAVTVIHEGDANLRAASTTTTLTVAKGSASAPKLVAKGLIKASKKGKATVTVKSPTGLAKAGGKVKIVLTKGKVKKTITTSLSSGKATVRLPKLAKGTWKAKVTYLGDTTYQAGKTVNAKLKVKKG